MSKTSITWVRNADGSQGKRWDIVTGCTKVSTECKHCFAEREWARFSKTPGTRYHGRKFSDVQTHPEDLTLPMKVRKPTTYFVAPRGDLFHKSVPFDFIDKALAVMALSERHTFLILTKRAERMHEYFATRPVTEMVGIEAEAISGLDRYHNNAPRWPWPLQNVWLGVTAGDQNTANERIPLLLQIPAALRYVSVEPMVGPVALTRIRVSDDHYIDALNGYQEQGHPNDIWPLDKTLDWVIVGGESGFAEGIRPMHPQWVTDLRDQCIAAGVPFMFKQWGEWVPRSDCYHTFEDGSDCASLDPGCTRWPRVIRLTYAGTDGRRLENTCTTGDDAFVQRVGKQFAGRLLNGVVWDQMPKTAEVE